VAEEKSKPQGIKRSDPDPRPVEGATNRVAVAGKDPNKHYVWVSETNDPTMNPGSYLSTGYQFTQHDPDGANPVMGYNPNLKQGDHLKSFGCVLMECSIEHKAELDRGGQEWANKMEHAIKRREVLDETEPLSAIERAKMSGITTRRYAGDTRENWGF
jgi:hypothetical protein